MADPVQITFLKGANGVSSVRFEMAGLEGYAFSFSDQGKVTLNMPDSPQGRLMRFGLTLIISQELKMDLAQTSLPDIAPTGTAATDSPQALAILVKKLKQLCAAVNSYFISRAAFYAVISHGDCHVKNAYVCTRNQKLAYRQLVALDADFYHRTRNVA